MIKLIASFDCEIDNKKCKFLMDHDTPLAIAKEMAFAFLKYLGQVEDAAKAAAEAQKKAEEESENQSKIEPIEQTNSE